MIKDRESDKIYDLVSNGTTMTLEDLKEFIDIVFLHLNPQQVSQLTQSLGSTVTGDEFHSILEILVLKRAGSLDVFNSWDKGQKGYIDRSDLEAILRSYGLSFKESYIDMMIDMFKDRKMRLEDFNKIYKEE
ncbi:uncharacterized protein Eint_011190 [Encephalitozoon intestinalis ATCC 50506]|uniref:EF-hand domain-containing protein n=1 Tax=Encephalitozoon intestinalis (strain ATCC 50506) TaxID=876142 RepID=E0S5J6_ENCIT|nr:uncharacterized protein Eint_011190 [Encephalitozoon intestinalis ATCC 50506]ADM10981.1 hypothetical protein Eint_011190 [Encephalitozoon intestinalis ATCC 50506]UTX44618.1 calcium-binding protein caltractin [Encephalitozoon intestinalis]